MRKLKTSTKVLIIVLASILFALCVTVIACAIFANSSTYTEPGTPPEIGNNWMSYIATGTALKTIAIPGSHDAGTYDMSYLGKTQDKDIATQLNYGVRYLDLRPIDDNGTLKIFHGPLTGSQLEPMLRAVRVFLKQNPSEIVILDFQHFKNNSQAATKAMVDSIFDSSLRITKTSSSTDSDYIDNLKYNTNTKGKVLIFWGSDSDDALSSNYIFKRNNDEGTRTYSALHSPYVSQLNKKDSAYYIDNGLPQYIDTYVTTHQAKGLFVLQGQLTDGLFVFGPQFRERTHNDNMNAYLASANTNGILSNINIVMRDFVDGTKVAHILTLNSQKGILVNNDDKKAQYNDALAPYLNAQ